MTPRKFKRLAKVKIAKLMKTKRSVDQRPMSVVLLVVFSIIIFSGFVTAQNIFVIDDNGSTTIQYSFSTNVDEVLRSANIHLTDNDLVTYEYSGGDHNIVIRRSTDITVVDGDNFYSYVGYGETVSSVLNNLGIVLGEYDSASLPLLSIASGEIIVNRAYTEVAEVSEIIPFDIEYCASNSIEPAPPVVLRNGEDGEMINYFLVSYSGSGEELSRSFICTEITLEPIDELISVDNNVLTTLSARDSFTKYLVDKNDDGSGIITTLSGNVYEFSKSDVFECTAYSCEGYSWRTTYTGTYAEVGVVAVDPKIIPLGTKLFIASNDGDYVYGYCIAEDTGAAVNGKIIDLYYDTVSECWQFGRRNCTVYFIVE